MNTTSSISTDATPFITAIRFTTLLGLFALSFLARDHTSQAIYLVAAIFYGREA